MNRKKLIEYLDAYLNIAGVKDYGPQGLQVESEAQEVDRVALAVDSAPAVIEAAAEWTADLLLVHHGLLWRLVEPIAGPLGLRVRMLLKHSMSLYSAHLPLDAHPEVGNNAVLARALNVSVDRWWHDVEGTPIGVFGKLPGPVPLDAFVASIEEYLRTIVRALTNGPDLVRDVAIVSGHGARAIGEASSIGADTFLTGETSHSDFWSAADHEVNVIFAGHYATETVGVKALGKHLENQFGLEVRFFDFPTAM